MWQRNCICHLIRSLFILFKRITPLEMNLWCTPASITYQMLLISLCGDAARTRADMLPGLTCPGKILWKRVKRLDKGMTEGENQTLRGTGLLRMAEDLYADTVVIGG